MQFATSDFAAVGRAALALWVALIKELKDDGKLRPIDIQNMLKYATSLVDGHGVIDERARTVIQQMSSGVF